MPATDRELLRQAAKAAGYALCTWPDEKTLRAEVEPGWRPVWDPLTSDGDALRLAVKLRMDIRHNDPQDTDAWVMAGESNDCLEDVDQESSRPAATRRAIVRCAAAMAAPTSEGENTNAG